jgi:DnaK suppressor protein
MTTTDRVTSKQPNELSPAQLVELTELLTQERAALSIPPPEGDVDLADDPGARLSAREVVETLSGIQAAQLEQIDHALARIEDGTYGTCEGCGQAIPAARLEVMPSATACVTCQAGA